MARKKRKKRGVGGVHFTERPLAAPGLVSYRARGRYGWIMIGARDAADALREAHRSTPAPTDLQIWNGSKYVPVKRKRGVSKTGLKGWTPNTLKCPPRKLWAGPTAVREAASALRATPGVSHVTAGTEFVHFKFTGDAGDLQEVAPPLVRSLLRGKWWNACR